MVSLEEIVSLVTRGTPRGDFPHDVLVRVGGGGGGSATMVSDAGAGESKAGEVDGAVEEPKAEREVSRSVGNGVQEHKEQPPQEERGANAGSVNEHGKIVRNPGGSATAAAEEPPAHVLLPGTSSAPPPPSSWFRNRPDEPRGGVGGREELPLPAEVRWAFMWLLDSVFFSVKEPVEGLDRHPAVHALLQDLLAVRAVDARVRASVLACTLGPVCADSCLLSLSIGSLFFGYIPFCSVLSILSGCCATECLVGGSI